MKFDQAARIDWFARLQASNPDIRLVHDLVAVAHPSQEIWDDFASSACRVLCQSMGLPETSDFSTIDEMMADGNSAPAQTPGSIVRISYDNFLAYARLHRSLLRMIEHIGLRSQITGLGLGNLRVVPGQPPEADSEKRPYATSKRHSDVWAGEPEDIMHLWFVLSREDDGAFMELYAPAQRLFDEGWLRPLDDYNAAVKLWSGDPLPISNAPGQAVMFDGSCPHNTVFGERGLRISFDVKFLRHPKPDIDGYASRFYRIEEFETILGGDNLEVSNQAPAQDVGQ